MRLVTAPKGYKMILSAMEDGVKYSAAKPDLRTVDNPRELPKLLTDEHPLQLLPNLACTVGLNGAIFLQQLHYWLQRSGNVRDDHVWVYNSIEDWREDFPFWGLNTIRRTVSKLIKDKYLITGNYNEHRYDRTTWYRIDYEAIAQIGKATTQSGTSDYPDWNDPLPTLGSRFDKMGTPIPETTQETNSVDFSKRKNDTTTKRENEREDAPSAAPDGAMSDRPTLYAVLRPGEGVPESEPRDPTQGQAENIWGDALKRLSSKGTQIALGTFLPQRLDKGSLTVRAFNTQFFTWEQENTNAHNEIVRLLRSYDVHTLIVEPPPVQSLLDG